MVLCGISTCLDVNKTRYLKDRRKKMKFCLSLYHYLFNSMRKVVPFPISEIFT